MLSGNVELDLPGLDDTRQQSRLTLQRGDFVYYPAGFSHTLTATGSSPANYLMLKWRGTQREVERELTFQKHNALAYSTPSDDQPGFRPRRVFQHPTGYLGLLNCHVSTLSPGAGYDPHTDPYDVTIILLEGVLEAAGERLIDHGVMFFAAGVEHGIFNPGPTTSRYLVFEFHEGSKTRPVAASSSKSMAKSVSDRAVSSRLHTRTEGSSTSQPVFVLGSGRSGTTLIQRILNAAPNVSIFGEHNGFLAPLAEAYFAQKSKGCIRTIADGNDLAAEVMGRLKDPASWPGWLNPYREVDLPTEYARLIEHWFNPAWARSRFWGFKEIRYGLNDRVIGFLIEMFPESRFVLVVRNPVDAIASQRVCAFGPFETLLDNWIQANTTYDDFARRYPEQFYLVDYRNLIDSPTVIVGEMYAWLGLERESDGVAVVDALEGRYEMRPQGQLPRQMLSGEMLARIFDEAGNVVLRLGLNLPIRPMQSESVAIELEGETARIGPFSDGRLITTDAVVLAVWLLCDGERNLDDVLSEMVHICEPKTLFDTLRELLHLGAIKLSAEA